MYRRLIDYVCPEEPWEKAARLCLYIGLMIGSHLVSVEPLARLYRLVRYLIPYYLPGTT